MSGSTQLFYFNYDISHLKVSQRLIQQLMSKRGAVNVYLLIIMLSITISLTQFINDIAHYVSTPPSPPPLRPALIFTSLKVNIVNHFAMKSSFLLIYRYLTSNFKSFQNTSRSTCNVRNTNILKNARHKKKNSVKNSIIHQVC